MWTGFRFPKGYGCFWIGKGETTKAHRIAWMIVNGKIPNGLCVLHKCDNPPCVRPSHLFLGTVADNNADMKAKGRQVCGESVVGVKLTESDVRSIRRLSGKFTQVEIAFLFGICERQVRRIEKRKRWKHVS